MNAFDEATLKKTFGGSKPSSKLSSKTKWYHSYSCYDNSQSCKQLKKCVTDNYFEKKLGFELQSPSVSENVCYYYNTWVTGIYMVYMVGRRGKTPQIEWLFESNFRPCGHSSSDLQIFPFFSGPKVQRQLPTRVSWVL